MRTFFLIVISAALVAIISACAGSHEKQAFEELSAVEKAIYQSSADRETIDEASLTAGDTASLELFLRYAALNNPNLKAAFNRWKAVLERIPRARSLPDPRFTYGYFIREVETRVGPQQHRLSIAQMFPWFGKLSLQGDVALEAANAARAGYDAAKLKLFYQVKEAYYEYCYLARAIEVMEENVELMSYLESVVLAKYRVGTAPHSDLIKVQVELDRLHDQLKSTQDLMNPVKARLNTAMNRSTRAHLPPPGKVEVDTVQISNDLLMGWLKESNPELKANEFLAAREKFSLDLAKKSYFPDITLGVDYIVTGEARMPGVMDSGKDPLIAMLSINLPLWWGRSGASVNEAKARYRSALNQRQNSENELLSRLEMVLYQFREAQRKIGLYQDALLPRAQQALNVTQTAFATDKVDFLNLIDAQRTYLEFELSLERAKSNYAGRLAELEMLVGREIPKRGE
jgi:outer membrane protein TolC